MIKIGKEKTNRSAVSVVSRYDNLRPNATVCSFVLSVSSSLMDVVRETFSRFGGEMPPVPNRSRGRTFYAPFFTKPIRSGWGGKGVARKCTKERHPRFFFNVTCPIRSDHFFTRGLGGTTLTVPLVNVSSWTSPSPRSFGGGPSNMTTWCTTTSRSRAARWTVSSVKILDNRPDRLTPLYVVGGVVFVEISTAIIFGFVDVASRTTGIRFRSWTVLVEI